MQERSRIFFFHRGDPCEGVVGSIPSLFTSTIVTMKESVEEEKGCPRLVKFQDEEKKEEENEDELDSTELPPTVPQDSRESDLLRSKAVQVLKVWKQSPSSNSKSLVRIRQSEVTGGGHECAATPVCSVTYCAQARSNRMRRMLLSRLGASREQRDLISEPKQYRFASRQHCERRGSCLRRCWDRITGAGDDEDKLFKNRLSLASLIAQHLNWTYRASFMMVFLNFAIGFWGFTVIWAGLILATATFRPECMKVGALHVTETERHFYSDAYALSWTTFRYDFCQLEYACFILIPDLVTPCFNSPKKYRGLWPRLPTDLRRW
jgi:hypothetical protein